MIARLVGDGRIFVSEFSEKRRRSRGKSAFRPKKWRFLAGSSTAFRNEGRFDAGNRARFGNETVVRRRDSLQLRNPVDLRQSDRPRPRDQDAGRNAQRSDGCERGRFRAGNPRFFGTRSGPSSHHPPRSETARDGSRLQDARFGVPGDFPAAVFRRSQPAAISGGKFPPVRRRSRRALFRSPTCRLHHFDGAMLLPGLGLKSTLYDCRRDGRGSRYSGSAPFSLPGG